MQIKVVKDAVQAANAGPARRLHPDDAKVIKDVVKGLVLATAVVIVVHFAADTVEEVLVSIVSKK